MTTAAAPIHPFPARMAPEIALEHCANLPEGSLVLDPMVGSGTTIRTAIDTGHRAVGFDMDPLAVLMSRVWTTPLGAPKLLARARAIAEKAQALDPGDTELPWIDDDAESSDFVDRWFAAPQKADLRKLASVLHGLEGPAANACRLALSRTIITKDSGASLARDVSHSRPHRVADTNDYDVFAGFTRAAALIAKRLEDSPPRARARVALGDARALDLEPGSIDAVVTSPPYLNAIDYMRGHRMSLVWLGHQLGALRSIRSAEIGAERAGAPKDEEAEALKYSVDRIGAVDGLPPRTRHILERYVLDLRALLRSLHEALRPGGSLVLVVGNSSVRGVFLRNDLAISDAAVLAGFRQTTSSERTLPANRRYLPPPSSGDGLLAQRMRSETVMVFARP